MDFIEAKIIAIEDNFDTVKTYILEKPEDFNWEAGSCIHVGLEGFKPKSEGEKPNRELVHHYSIFSLPKENTISFSTRFTGELSTFKNALLNYKVGDKITLFKPHLRLNLRRENRPIVFCSMGIGIVTFRPIIKEFIEDDSNITNIINLNVSQNKEFLFKNELDKIESEIFKNIWVNNKEEFYAELENTLKLENPIYYVVGSDEYLNNVMNFLVERNVKLEDILIDHRDDKKIELFESDEF